MEDLFFKNKKEKNISLNILNNLYFLNKKLFYIKNNKKNNFFYKINLKSKFVMNKEILTNYKKKRK